MQPSSSLLGYLKLGIKAEYLRGISSVSIARAPQLVEFPTLVENDPARRYCVQAVVDALDELAYLMQDFGLRKSLAVAAPLAPMVQEMKEYLVTSQSGREAFLNDPFAQRLVENAKALGAMIEVEVAERRTIDLDLTAATETILGLAGQRAAAGRPLSPAELQLWDDAVRALCTGAGRAAVLAAWECGWSLIRRTLAGNAALAGALHAKGLSLTGHNAASVLQVTALCAENAAAAGVPDQATREEVVRLWEDRQLLIASDAQPTLPVVRGYVDRVAKLCAQWN